MFVQLASFGVDYIEAGWPGSNPKDAEFFYGHKQNYHMTFNKS
jgi:isopropylmalate/homocitrate/citramalate synthase